MDKQNRENTYKIIKNELLGDDMYLLKAQGTFEAKIGQFYMIRTVSNYPLLSRPISIYDIDDQGISFIYKLVGEGTEAFKRLREGDDIILNGPYGNGFPKVEGKTAVLGGGIGIAPLYLICKDLYKNNSEKSPKADAYLGFSNTPILVDEFEKYCNKVKYSLGDTFVTDIINVEDYDNIMVCGPTPMMKKVVEMTKGKDINVYVSLENRMACGVGACLVCTCKTSEGNKRTCKDGPVFKGEEVIF